MLNNFSFHNNTSSPSKSASIKPVNRANKHGQLAQEDGLLTPRGSREGLNSIFALFLASGNKNQSKRCAVDWLIATLHFRK